MGVGGTGGGGGGLCGWGAGMCLTYLHPTVDLQLQRGQWGSEGRGVGGEGCLWWMGGREVSDTYLHPRVDLQLVSGGGGEFGWGGCYVCCGVAGMCLTRIYTPELTCDCQSLCVHVGRGGGWGGDNSVL